MTDGLWPSPHCTHPGCERTDTATTDGVNGRRCDEHPATLRLDYVRHLAHIGMRLTAGTYLRAWIAARREG